MIFTVAAISSFLWFIFIVILLRFKQTPESQLRKRLNEMIDQAEAARVTKIKKNVTPTAQAMKDGVAEQPRISFKERVITPIVKWLEEHSNQGAD